MYALLSSFLILLIIIYFFGAIENIIITKVNGINISNRKLQNNTSRLPNDKICKKWKIGDLVIITHTHTTNEFDELVAIIVDNNKTDNFYDIQFYQTIHELNTELSVINQYQRIFNRYR